MPGEGAVSTGTASSAVSPSFEKLKTLVKSRRYIRQRITRTYNQVRDNIESLDDRKIKTLITNLHSFKAELAILDRDIYACGEEDDVDNMLDEGEVYEERISEALQILENVSTIEFTPLDSHDNNSNKIKLPQIQLPEFHDYKVQSLEIFLHSFESIISKHKLSSYEKFIYLKGQLKNSPRALVESLDSDEQSYETAIELLVQAFGSSLTQKYDVISRLTKLKLRPGDDPYEFIGEIKKIRNAVTKLEIDSDIFMQYFMWGSLNDLFQNQVIQIVNKSKPNLDEIFNCMFEAAERYLKVQNRTVVKNSFEKPDVKSYNTNFMAVNIKSKDKFYACNLCSSDENKDSNHSMRNCTAFPNPEDKVQKLRSLNACTKCSFKNHTSRDCKFRFTSNCKLCLKPHMTFLCLNKEDKNYSKISSQHNTSTSTSHVESMNAKVSHNSDSTMLPTLTVRIENGKYIETVRAIKDGGSQRNFILESLAEKLNLCILKPVELLIHGFNSSKPIKTKIVKVPIILNGDKTEIEATVIPKVNIELIIPNIERVAKEFERLGYILADENLTCCKGQIKDFGLVLGAESDPILPLNYRTFGSKTFSSYIETPVGIMLSGNVKLMEQNLLDLKDLKTENSEQDKTDTLKGFEEEKEFCVDSVTDSLVSMNISDEVNGYDGLNLNEATKELLEDASNMILNVDNDNYSVDNEINEMIINYVIKNTERAEDGRLIMPLIWNHKIKDLLATNYNLCKSILMSNFNKLSKNHDKLIMYDSVFKEQEKLGIISQVDNLSEFMKDHKCSFLPHMGVFKLDRETTKCRVVFLSNLCEKNSSHPVVSHNQALMAGPSLNQKLSTVITFSRFNKFIINFDLVKAFLTIGLRECDRVKLLFLWFRDVANNDLSVVAYLNQRLSFGLRPSPTILMLALFKILILDIAGDDGETIYLKRSLYHQFYMDNGSFSCNSEVELFKAFESIPKIFDSYKFKLQQFTTNSKNLQTDIDESSEEQTPEHVKYFGMSWNRIEDTLSPVKLQLNPDAKTKRQILSSLHSIYDLFNMYAPLLNRAKLFFQNLQKDKNLQWDTVITPDRIRDWKMITKQANSTPDISVPRFVGSRDSKFDLVAFTDASKLFYGVVIYLRDKNDNSISFLTARNKIVGTDLTNKTIPSLEFQALSFGVECLIDLYRELSGDKVMLPIDIVDIYLYTDSMVCLSWLQSYFTKYDKMQKRSPFIMNRLKGISELCSNHEIKFSHVEGCENPADFVTRRISYKQLSKSTYFTGPKFLRNIKVPEIEVIVPNPFASIADEIPGEESQVLLSSVCATPCDLCPLDKYESFQKVIGVTRYVLLFISRVRKKIAQRKGEDSSIDENLFVKSCNLVLSNDQKRYFSDVYEFYLNRKKSIRDVPDLVHRYNIYMDDNGLLRVKGKLSGEYEHPILLSKDSHLTELIIRDKHESLSHSGIYSTLKEMRKSFFIAHYFSAIKRVLRDCIKCRKSNARPVKLNQNKYRDFRISPPPLPFASIFLDYMGPFDIKMNGVRKKIWILIITCLWSRAINMLICFRADVKEFLRSLQIHIYSYGMFGSCMSDLGSQITAGASIITEFLDDHETSSYLERHGIDRVQFQHYCKGNSSLGSLIENCVKQTKRLMTKSVGRAVLEFEEFDLMLNKTVHLINRRPIAFTDSLRDSSMKNDFPDPISPECLLKGRELPSLNIIPNLNGDHESETEYFPNNSRSVILSRHSSFRKANARLVDLYHHEFLNRLLVQSIDQKDRYKPCLNKELHVGDIVLLTDKFCKQSNYPMGIIKSVETNSLKEVTAAKVLKGDTKEVVYRHSSSLIPLLRGVESDGKPTVDTPVDESSTGERIKRNAAVKSDALTRALAANDMI